MNVASTVRSTLLRHVVGRSSRLRTQRTVYLEPLLFDNQRIHSTQLQTLTPLNLSSMILNSSILYSRSYYSTIYVAMYPQALSYPRIYLPGSRYSENTSKI